ncbi:SDR family oxidoreductase [Acidiphilium sp. AL]|uniref:SDR family NAD(P)-dependent oxidoreductase n=1 Tax=Acidiphilium sp. AL TaxID=2871704 RepID=UPI0021CB046D|nr:SDR family NAD(P)-dependent oxidoreductase [Acidiphilium sp. AL]
MMRITVKGKVAVLTGAASGIGAALARQLAARGASLALIDRDQDGLERVAAEARLFGATVSTHVADLADPAAIAALPDAIAATHAAPALLINNAGVALVGRFDQMDAADFDWLMDINFWAGVRMTRAFLPALRRASGARIVFLSSVFGIIAPPGQCAYAASKFAIRGFAEALRHELADTPIGVTVVHPGGIRTNIARSARLAAGMNPEEAAAGVRAFETMLKTTPEVAASTILRGVERGADRVLIGSDAYAIDALQRLMPARYWRPMQRRLGKLGGLVKAPAEQN